MSKCVFVGNIPYDVTEDQLIGIFNEAGPVVSFRLVTDRETGKPKGYGFCEYRDAETAQSAIRNLNDHPLNGRNLRVDYADTEKGLGDQNQHRQPAGGGGRHGGRDNSQGQNQRSGGNAGSANAPPENPFHGQGAVNPQDIANALQQAIPQPQLREAMAHMKILIQQDREQARKYLMDNPQLGQTFFQALILMNLVSDQDVNAMVQSQQQGPPQGHGGQGQMYPPQQGGYMGGQPGMADMGQQMGDAAQLEQQQQALLQQLMTLTPQQINSLPPDQRQLAIQMQQQMQMQRGPAYM